MLAKYAVFITELANGARWEIADGEGLWRDTAAGSAPTLTQFAAGRARLVKLSEPLQIVVDADNRCFMVGVSVFERPRVMPERIAWNDDGTFRIRLL